MLEVIKTPWKFELGLSQNLKRSKGLGTLLTVHAETIRRKKSLPVGHKPPAWLSAGEQNPADSAKGCAKCSKK